MSDTQGVAEATGWNPPEGGTQLTCSPWADLDDLPDGCPCRTVESGGDLPTDDELLELIDDATDALFVLLDDLAKATTLAQVRAAAVKAAES